MQHLDPEFVETVARVVRLHAKTSATLTSLTDIVRADMATRAYTADAAALAGLTEDLPDLVAAIATLISEYAIKLDRQATADRINAHITELEGGAS